MSRRAWLWKVSLKVERRYHAQLRRKLSEKFKNWKAGLSLQMDSLYQGSLARSDGDMLRGLDHEANLGGPSDTY